MLLLHIPTLLVPLVQHFFTHTLLNNSVIIYTHLILIKATVLVLLFTLVLEGHDNKTYEDVDHEEGNNDDVDDVVDCNHWSVVMHWSHVLCVGVYGDIQQSGKGEIGKDKKNRSQKKLQIQYCIKLKLISVTLTGWRK